MPISYKRKAKKKKNIFFLQLFDAIRHRRSEQHHSHTGLSRSMTAPWQSIALPLAPQRFQCVSGRFECFGFCWLNRLWSWTERFALILRFVNGIISDYLETDRRDTNNQYTRVFSTCTFVHGASSSMIAKQRCTEMLSSVRQDLVGSSISFGFG